MNEPIFVSAFFDIGRGDKNQNAIPRSTNKYFEYFSNWCRIKNQLVVFTEPQFVEKIYDIRRKYNLEAKTKVIAINNFYSIEPEIFQNMKRVENNKFYDESRLFSHAMSNKASYDYVMLLKYYCLKETKKLFSDCELLVWMDFGFDHGGKRFQNQNEYSFIWKPTLSINKITLFSLYNPEKVGNLEMLQLQTDCIMGCFLLVPAALTDDLWKWMKEAMTSLLMLECIDDDQMLLLMVLKKYQKDFQVIESDWFLPFALYGNGQLTLNEKQREKGLQKVLNDTKARLRCLIKGQKQGSVSALGKRLKQRLETIRGYEIQFGENFKTKNKNQL